MSSVKSIDGQQFLAYLRASGLLARKEIDGLTALLTPQMTGRDLAQSLVQEGKLTRFQSELLLNGKVQGFFLGPYRILDQLGRGGMGRVFKAEHQKLKRLVAIKILSNEILSTERAQELFLREMRVVGRLTHPNVVTAFDANEIAGRYFLVLEYVNGSNLEQMVRKNGPLPVAIACNIISQCATGLQAAHAMGMVHRDLKPANILLQVRGSGVHSPGLIKISDFGLARLLIPAQDGSESPVIGTIMTRENTVMGTPDYLSPEQARNLHATDIRSDIYSLGCTFYFLLTGKVPFPGGKAVDKVLRHFSEKPVPVTHFRNDVPAPVLAILDKMMAKRPDDRYQTPSELADAIEPFGKSGSIPWAFPSTASESTGTDEIILEGMTPPDALEDLEGQMQAEGRNRNHGPRPIQGDSDIPFRK